jgi:cytochrome c-type biogenesis protein CcmH/NrfF
VNLPATVRRLSLVCAVLALTALTAATTVATATTTAARASLTAIENDVMCVACHESLAVAQSPEAYSERQYIRTLIAQGETRKQIENNLVQQYGPSVLALPPAHGFNLLVYIIPPLVLVVGIATVVLTLPRWRRRTREAAAGPGPAIAAALTPDDARRLDEDLGRHL